MVNLPMDIRRVQITGGSSFMVTLPKEWANSVGLRKNDSVGLQMQPDGSLSLYPKGTAPESKRTTKVIDATEITSRGFMYRQLVGAYIAGHVNILVTSETPMSSTITSAVSTFVQTSIGLETMEADDTHLLISDLLDHEDIEPKKILDRMRLLVKGMVSDLYEAAYTGNLDPLRELEYRDKEIDRIYWLTSRQCNMHQKDVTVSRKMNLSLYDLTSCLSVSRVLESIGDHSIVMSKYLLLVADSGKVYRINKDAHAIGLMIIDLINNSVKSWVDRDLMLAEQCIKDADKIIATVNETTKNNIEGEQYSATVKEITMFSSKRISEYCKDIAEFAINMAME